MTSPLAYHLTGDMLRLLLAGLGCRTAWLPVDDRPLQRTEAVQQMAVLVRSGAVHNDAAGLQMEPPLQDWLMAVAGAPCTVRFSAPRAFFAQGCLYPAGEQAVCLLASGAEQLRLCALPRAGLWQALCDLEPALCLPEAPPEAEAPPYEAGPLPNPVLLLQRYRPDSLQPLRGCAAFGPGYYLLQASPSAPPVPWRNEAVQTLLETWIWGDVL